MTQILRFSNFFQYLVKPNVMAWFRWFTSLVYKKRLKISRCGRGQDLQDQQGTTYKDWLDWSFKSQMIDWLSQHLRRFNKISQFAFIQQIYVCAGVVILHIENKSAPLRGRKIINLPQNRAMNFQKCPYF